MARASTLILLTIVVALSMARGENFSIQKIVSKLVSVPEYQYAGGPAPSLRNHGNSCFLALEVEFSYQPKTEADRYMDQLLFTYYLLLNVRSLQHPNGILLMGSVMHDAICARRERRSVMYVAPSTLDRFFQGRVLSSVAQIVYDIGVTISKEGRCVALRSWKGQGPWWEKYSPLSGFILNKNQTPFAPLLWEDYEQIRSEHN